LLFILSFLFITCAGSDHSTATDIGWVIGNVRDKDTGILTVKILKTSNGGASWVLQNLPDECDGFYGNDISAGNNQVAWAAIADSLTNTDGGILHTADGGETWTLQNLPSGMTSRHIKGIKGVSFSEAWAVSLGGDVLHTTDAGIIWRIVPVRDAQDNVIAMTEVNRMDVTGQDIWIVDVAAEHLGVIHSADAGATWRREELPDVAGTGYGPLAISAFDSRTAWTAVNSSGYLWWTSNGGQTWSKSNDSLTGTADYDDINASSADIVWIACNGGGSNGGFTSRVRVTDGNFNANTTNHPPYMMEGISPMTDDKAWAVGFKMSFVNPDLPMGAIYFTEDGGLNWQSQNIPDNARDVAPWKVSFVGAKR